MKKRILNVLFVWGITISFLSAAPKKNVADFKKEIESEIGSVSWSQEEGLKKAKQFKGTKNFYLGEYFVDGKSRKVIIINPAPSSNGQQTILEINESVGESFKTFKNSFDELEKGDVFLTYYPWTVNDAYVWLLESKKTLKKALSKNTKGGFSLDPNCSIDVMKYDGWTQGTTKQSLKGLVRGRTEFYENACSYATVANWVTGSFSLLICNFYDLSVTEIKLVNLGKRFKGQEIPFNSK